MNSARGANTPFYQRYLFLITLQKPPVFQGFWRILSFTSFDRNYPTFTESGGLTGGLFFTCHIFSPPPRSSTPPAVERKGSHAAHRHAVPYRQA
jgi:hypothetical protein